ncbi:hypothetical protein KFZ70_15875 [Tamlana fucoidanivorans]|uniref:Right-handed parallel beta-helix repeat-containing protein n=1 Tax=Allotamlana fucoidanivorans TaxID=2583814 RepID=A0A5C4SH57_9FLAO|nr:hypothetical protein [Tamlana fucoidanivorans]TNJ42979.1 hypothetical protein FGF67_13400 [Tamlana fucoidanivorans]
MKRYFYFFIFLGFITLWSSCRKDFEFTPATGNLQFSKDTVYLDTVFTNIGSSTYNLKVYNKSNNDISIPIVKLALGETSYYRLNVDGLTGKNFENVEILANDSLFIFVESTININNFPNPDAAYLYTDQIEFNTGTNLQKVELVTLVKDAVFIYPDRDETTKVIETLKINIDGELVETDLQGRELLPEELTFTNEKPYVIYGFAAVPENKTLTIEAGARLHFHDNSGLIVLNNASLHINGTYSTDQQILENEVILEGDRLEPEFSDVPGQWGTIWLFEGSINNRISYATIKNATIGVLSDGNLDTPNNKLNLSNTQIYNASSFGVLGRNTSIKAENMVINNSGLSSFAGTFGGKYNLTHCTITNYWNNGFRQFPALLLNNFVLDEDNNAIVTDLTEANFNNCLIYGNDNIEILLDELEDETVNFNFKFTNCLMRFNDHSGEFDSPNYDFNNVLLYENVILNQNPDFKNTEQNNMLIGNESEGINKGNIEFASQIPLDLLNINRTSAPDIGAYQHTTFPEE